MNRKGTLSTAELRELDRHRYISLVTFRRDGRAVATPVWFAVHEGKIYVFSEAKAGKVKRLRASPRLRIAPCDVRGRLKGDWIDGTGRRVEEPDTAKAGYDALGRKYGWQMRVTNLMSRLTGRIHKRALLELEV